jgi:hypothetical protein
MSTRSSSSAYRSLARAHVSLPNVIISVVIVSAGACAAGQSLSGATSTSPSSSRTVSGPVVSPVAAMHEREEETGDLTGGTELLPVGHPPIGGSASMAAAELPPGHPPVDSTVAQAGSVTPTPSAPESSPLDWKAPERWQPVASASRMRLATYRIPRLPSDSEDAELSVVQAGGSVDANVARWMGQFDAAGQKTARHATRKVGPLDITVVELQGTYSGGMGTDASPRAGWALLGAIVPTSTDGMPCFFKLTGPARSVLAARAEFDALTASLAPR